LLLFLLASALTIVFVACAGGEAAPSAEQRATVAKPTIRTTVYFLTKDASAPLGVRRAIDRTSPYAREALDELLGGPTTTERKRGITTAIPTQAHLVSLRLVTRRAGTDAFINLTEVPPAAGVSPGKQPSVLMRVRALTQIARTLIGLSDIARVWVRVDSRPWDLPRINGRLGDAPTDYQRLRGWWRICAGQRTRNERAAGLSRCFSALP